MRVLLKGTAVDGSGYVLLADGTVISTHATIAEAVKVRDEQSKSRGAQVPSDASDGTAPKPDPQAVNLTARRSGCYWFLCDSPLLILFRLSGRSRWQELCSK